MSDNIIWIASFDIGKKNFAFYVEEINRDALSAIPIIATCGRYNRDGTPTLAFAKVLKQVYTNGKVILHRNVDITDGCDGSSYLEPEMFHNMTDILDHYSGYWDQCDAYVVEQQMSFGLVKGKSGKQNSKQNTMAVKLGQHCWSYFALRYGRSKPVVEFPAYHKTQILGAPKVPNKSGKGYKAMDKPARKKWSAVKMIEILTERGDWDVLDTLSSIRKKDDLADTLCQLQAYKFLTYVDKSI
jgi:hypothetical protein